MHRQQTSLIFVSWLSVWRWRGAREIRIALNSTIIALICLSSERTLSHLLDKLSSKWAGPYTRRLSRLLDSSSSRREWPIYPISCRVNGPCSSSRWAVRVNGSEHIDELIIADIFGKYQISPPLPLESPIHGSLLIDPIPCLVEENPWVGWKIHEWGGSKAWERELLRSIR